MSSEKKVIFSAQDNVSQKAKQIYSEILSGAKKYSDTLREQTGYINAQIKALEKKAKLESKQGEKIFQEQGELYWTSKNPAEKERYAQNSKRIRSELTDSAAVLDFLKKIHEEAKKQTTASAKAEAEQRHEYQSSVERDKEQGFSWVSGGKGRSTKGSDSPPESHDYKDREECCCNCCCCENEGGSGDGKGKKDKSVTGEVFLGTLLGNVVSQVIKSLSQLTGAQSGEEGVNTLLGGIPLVGGLLSGSSGRNFEEQLAIQTKELELGAKTGGEIRGLTNKTNLGYSTRESLSMIEGLITSAGNRSGANQAGNALTMQRGLGLSQDVITQIVKDLRTTRSSADIMQIASDVLAANPELRKDQTKFAEILQQTSQLTNQLANQTENVDPRANAGIVGALRSIGGSFSNPEQAAARMMSINQSLTSPGTDYQKSRGFGVLSGINPGGSYFQMLEEQEKGIGSKGYLGGILKQLRRETGGGEQLMLGVNQNLGLGASTSRKLVEAFEKNPEMFDKLAVGGKGDLEKVLGISGRAESATSQRDREKAETDNAFSISASAGMWKVSTLTFESAVSEFKTIVKSLGIQLGSSTGVSGTTSKIHSPGVKPPNLKPGHILKIGPNGKFYQTNGETEE
jgi:hypothetical protein